MPEIEQLDLFPRETKPHDFSNLKCPLQDGRGYFDIEISHHRFAYFNHEVERIILSPYPLKISFWSCAKTGEMLSAPTTPKILDFIQEHHVQRMAKYASEDKQLVVTLHTPKRKPRKPYKWSKNAKARNRRNRLKKRIEKKHGYNPQQPSLFQKELLQDINVEYRQRLDLQPDYFAGETVNLYD